jgi:hypothetical protein
MSKYLADINPGDFKLAGSPSFDRGKCKLKKKKKPIIARRLAAFFAPKLTIVGGQSRTEIRPWHVRAQWKGAQPVQHLFQLFTVASV